MPYWRQGFEAALVPLNNCASIGSIGLVRGTNLLSVWSISMKNDSSADVAATTILGRGTNVYASAEALYVASPTYWSNLGAQTAVLRFGLADGRVTFRGVLVAPGYILNQVGIAKYLHD